MEPTARSRSVTAISRATHRSESRKRGRKSESPEPPTTTGRERNKQTFKKQKKGCKSLLEKDQTKITEFSESQQNHRPIEHIETTTNMAANTETLNNTQFEAIMAEFQKMNTKFDTKLEECMNKMNERVETVEGKIHDIENKLDQTNIDIKNLSQRSEACSEKSVEAVHAANLALAYAEKNEQYQRNFNIRIFNLPEDNNESIENCETKVLAFFKDKLDLTVPIEAIDNLHRLGPKKASRQRDTDNDKNNTENANQTANEQLEVNENDDNQQDKAANEEEMDIQIAENKTNSEARPVIVSFVSRRVRREVLANRYKLKKRDNQTTAPIIIVEDLTKQRHALFSKARENKEKFKKVWSKEGKIYGRQHNGLDIAIDTYLDITSPPIEKRMPPRRYKFFGFGGRGRGGYGRGGRGGYMSSYPSYQPYAQSQMYTQHSGEPRPSGSRD